jgi:hypothetical protein
MPSLPPHGNDPRFDLAIGNLDYCLSVLMMFADSIRDGMLSEPNKQTLKHHAEDMVLCAGAIFKRLGLGQEKLWKLLDINEVSSSTETAST